MTRSARLLVGIAKLALPGSPATGCAQLAFHQAMAQTCDHFGVAVDAARDGDTEVYLDELGRMSLDWAFEEAADDEGRTATAHRLSESIRLLSVHPNGAVPSPVPDLTEGVRICAGY